MNVTVAQTVEAGASCDTTITATVTAVIGAPAAEIPERNGCRDHDCSRWLGSAVFGVDLTIDDSEKNWGGEDEINYFVEIENTGQTNQTVNLEVAENSGPTASQHPPSPSP